MKNIFTLLCAVILISLNSLAQAELKLKALLLKGKTITASGQPPAK